MGFNWRSAWISLDREVAINVATAIGLIDERSPEMTSRRSPSIEAWAEVEKLLAEMVLAFMLFMEFFCAGLALPVLSYWTDQLGGDSFEVGIVIGIHYGAQSMLAKKQASFMRMWGYRPAAAACMLGMSLGYFMQYYAVELGELTGMPCLRNCHWTTNLTPAPKGDRGQRPGGLEFLIFGRIISGAAGSAVPVARGFVSKLCPGREGTRVMSMVMILPPIAFILGHAVASGASTYSTRAPLLLASWCSATAFFVGVLYLKEVRDIEGILSDVPEEDWQEKLRSEFTNLSTNLVGELGNTLDVKIDLKQLHTLLPPSLRVLLEPNVGSSAKGPSAGRESFKVKAGGKKAGGKKGGKAITDIGINDIGALKAFNDLAAMESGETEVQEKFYHQRGTDDQQMLTQVTLGVYTVLAGLVAVSGFIVHASWWGFLTALPQYLEGRFAFKTLDYCFILVAFNAIVPITQAVLYPFMAPRAGKHMTAAMGVFMMVLGNFSFTFADWPTVQDTSFSRGLMITIAPIPIGFGLYLAGAHALLKRYTRPPVAKASYHLALTTYHTMSGIGAFIGAMSFGSLYDVDNFYPFYVNGGWTVLGFVLMMQIYGENQCLAEHKERDDEDFEARRFWKTVTIAAHSICIPWCVCRTVIGIKMCLDSWGKDCGSVVFKVYVCISVSTILLAIIPEAVIGLGFANVIVAIVAFQIHTGVDSCAGTQWMQYITIDLAMWASVLCLAYMFLMSSSVLRPNIDLIYARFIRLVALPICLARVVLVIVMAIDEKVWQNGCTNMLVLKFSLFLSLFSFFTTASPKAFLGMTFLSVSVGTMALVAATDCKGTWAYSFTTFDTCLNIFAMAAVYCIWFAVLSPAEEVKNSVKIFAGYALGIPLSLGRLVLGYLLCGASWEVEAPDIYLFKLYVIFSMFGFIFVRKVEWFGTFTFVNTVIGLLCLTNTAPGADYGMWRVFVITDLWLGVGLAGLVYITWTHFSGATHETDLANHGFTKSAYGAHDPARLASARKESQRSESKRVARPSVVEDFEEDFDPAARHGGMKSMGSMRRDMARTEVMNAVKVQDARRKIKERASARKTGAPLPDDPILSKGIDLTTLSARATPAPMPRSGRAASQKPPLSVEVDDPAGAPPKKEQSPTAVAESPPNGRSTTWKTTVVVDGDRYAFTLNESSMLVSELLVQVQDRHRMKRGNADSIVGLNTASGHELDLDEDVTRCIRSGQTMQAELE